MYFDTHAHYDDERFNEDRKELLQVVLSSGVELILNPGCDIPSSEFAMRLSEEIENVYFAAGVHPENLEGNPINYLSIIRVLAENRKCVAIGEIGLDYFWYDTHKEEQKKVFVEQLELSLELDMPVIIHDREAHGDCIDIIMSYPSLKGVFHCFSGSLEMAKVLIENGWYLGFDGPVTYKNARKTVEVLDYCPLDRILIETDSPYLSPVPMRGKRNDSRNLLYISEKIAGIKGLSVEDVARITKENGCRLFGISGF